MSFQEEKIRFAGQLRFEEFVQINRLAAPWWARNFLWFLVGAFALALVSGGWRNFVEDPRAELFKSIPLGIFVVFAIVAPRIATRRNWKNDSSMNASVSGNIDSETVEWNGPFTQAR